MQLRFKTGLSSAEYVSERGWEKATLEKCPVHGEGSCRFAKHTAYPRKDPPGALIPRWYCPDAHQTFSLLPDCLCSRLPGCLDQVEAAVRSFEEAPSWEEAAQRARPDIEVQGALRWLRRRVALTRAALTSLVGLRPDRFEGYEPTLTSFASALGAPGVLVALREIASTFLQQLPPALGFGPRPAKRWTRKTGLQHDSGPDPPDSLR